MSTMEFNKVFGALTASLLVFLLAGFFSESVFSIRKPAQPGFAVEIETADGAQEAEPEEDFAALLAAADPAAGAAVFRKCGACHKIEDGANGVGPHLYGVVGRTVDSVAGYAYSGALEKVAEVWGFDELNAFLTNPKAYAPGTKMGFAGLAKASERAAVIAYLNEAGGSNLPLPERAEAAPAQVQEAAAPAEAETAPAESAEAAVEAAPEAAPVEQAAQSAPVEGAESGAAPVEAAAAETAAAEAAPVEAAPVEAAPAEAAAVAADTATAADPLAAALAAADPDHGARVFRKCGACHKIEEGRHGIGPSLWGVVGRDVASIDAYAYSDSMRAKEGSWTFAALFEYLENPRAVVPGTRMTFAGLPSAEDRAAVIVFLNNADGSPLPLDVAAAPAGEPVAGEAAQAAAEAAPVATEVAVAAAPVEAAPAAVEPVAVEATAETPAETPAEAATETVADASPAEAASAPVAAGAEDAFAIAYAAASAEDGKKVFRKCGACHKVEDGRNGVGPSLWGVVGRDIASIEGFKYSDALKGHDGAWEPRTISAFIENPKAWAPGTKMSFAGLAKIEDRASVIKYLNEAGGGNVAVQ